jgi:hypothetical protein
MRKRKSTYPLDRKPIAGAKADDRRQCSTNCSPIPPGGGVFAMDATHDIAIRRLEARSWLCRFHGGVPSWKRPALVERFRDDPTCRVFVHRCRQHGPNLQHARPWEYGLAVEPGSSNSSSRASIAWARHGRCR